MKEGKNNMGMAKSRGNTNMDDKGISQEVIHEHEWHFVKEIKDWGTIRDYPVVTSKFVCLCGAVKRVKQFEVEEQ